MSSEENNTEQKRGPGRPRKEQKAETVTVVVRRDFWPTDNEDDRVRKGQIIDVPPMDAIEGIESGAYRRVK